MYARLMLDLTLLSVLQIFAVGSVLAGEPATETQVEWRLTSNMNGLPDQLVVDENFAHTDAIAVAPTNGDQVDVLRADVWSAEPNLTDQGPIEVDLSSSTLRERLTQLQRGAYVFRSGVSGAIGLVPQHGTAWVQLSTPSVAQPFVAVNYELLVPRLADGIHVSLGATCQESGQTVVVDEVMFAPRGRVEGVRRIIRNVKFKNPCPSPQSLKLRWTARNNGGVSLGLLTNVTAIAATLRPTIAYTTVVGDDKNAPFLRNAFAAAVRELSLFNVITCKDDAIDEDSLVKPISERGWETTEQAGDRGRVLAALTAAGCRIPPFNRLLAARLAVSQDPQTKRQELVVALRDLENPLLQPLSFALVKSDSSGQTWRDVLREAAVLLHATFLDFPPSSHLELRVQNNEFEASASLHQHESFTASEARSAYLIIAACDERPQDCNSDTAEARLDGHTKRCRIPDKVVRSRSEYISEAACVLDGLRRDHLRIVYEGSWVNWPIAARGPVERYPVGSIMRHATEGARAYTATVFTMGRTGNWATRTSGLRTSKSRGRLTLSSGFRYTRYLDGTSTSINDAYSEFGVCTTWDAPWIAGRVGMAAGQSGPRESRVGGWVGLGAGIRPALGGRFQASLGIMADYASARFVGPHASLVLGVPMALWYPLRPTRAADERGQYEFGIYVEPNIDVTFGYSAGVKAGISLSRAY